jgi:hypothetical protein
MSGVERTNAFSIGGRSICGETIAAIAPASKALDQKFPPSTRVPGIPIKTLPGLQAKEFVESSVMSVSRAGWESKCQSGSVVIEGGRRVSNSLSLTIELQGVR